MSIQLGFHHIVAVGQRFAHASILVAGICPDPIVGVQDPVKALNHSTVGALIENFESLWVAIGDFSATPAELRKAGWLEQWHGDALPLKRNASHTYARVIRRRLDYVVCVSPTSSR